MIKIVKVIAVLLAFTLIGVEAYAQTDPQIRVVVVPLGGDAGPTFKTIFVTPDAFTGDLKDETKGDLDGPSGADRRCMEYAELPDSKVKGKTFKAWLSNAAYYYTDIFYFRTFTLYPLPYHNTNGEILFTSLEDLDVLPQNEFTTHSGQYFDLTTPGRYIGDPWTNIRTDGKILTDHSCKNWEYELNDHGAGSYGGYGILLNTEFYVDGDWTDYGRGSCSYYHSLLCFEQ